MNLLKCCVSLLAVIIFLISQSIIWKIVCVDNDCMLRRKLFICFHKWKNDAWTFIFLRIVGEWIMIQKRSSDLEQNKTWRSNHGRIWRHILEAKKKNWEQLVRWLLIWRAKKTSPWKVYMFWNNTLISSIPSHFA